VFDSAIVSQQDIVMKFIKSPHIFYLFIVISGLSLLVRLPSALAENTDETVDMFNAWQEQSSAASRTPKPLSQTAENTTIITRNEIEALNAHTLADVLATVSGIQIQNLGGAGSMSFTHIQGSTNYHVLVMVDGVPLNTLESNFSDTGMVPARIIERIEIVKGAASSAWGQALGGVINVITKAPDQRKIGGTATSSYGEGNTSDSALELTGKVDRLGYYFAGGYTGFRDIPPHITTDSNNGYAKLTYDLPDQGQIWGTFNYSHGNRTNLFLSDYNTKESQKTTYLFASLGIRQKLADDLELEVLGRHSYRFFDTRDTDIDDKDIQEGYPITTRERVYGGSAKLVWRSVYNLVVLGGDYEHAELFATNVPGNIPGSYLTVSKKVDRWGVFLNDTITIGDLAITPGVRVDHPSTSSDQFSPSLGITYPLGDKTLLRGYTARGYGLWTIAYNTTPVQKVWTSQVGVETSLVPYLWQKLTLFRNEIWNIGGDNRERNLALGAEYEIRTTPVFNTTLGAGYTFTDTKNTLTHSQVYGIPRHTVQVALRYDDSTFRAILTGRHIMWNTGSDGSYNGMIWDLHLGATLMTRENSSLEIFFSGHNLFDCSQTYSVYYPTPGRWFEGGMRLRF